MKREHSCPPHLVSLNKNMLWVTLSKEKLENYACNILYGMTHDEEKGKISSLFFCRICVLPTLVCAINIYDDCSGF